MKEIQKDNGEIAIFAGGKTLVYANESDIPSAKIWRNPAMLVQSRGVVDVQFCDMPFTFKNEMWAYTCDSKESVKYLYYYMKGIVPQLRAKASAMGSFPQISISDTEEIEIPLPPLPIQEAIVEILDKFESLQQSLQDELQARKKQYEYYRNIILEESRGFDSTNEVYLGDVCEIFTGGEAPSKNLIEGKKTTETPYPIYGNGKEVYGYTNTYRIGCDAVCISSIGANTGAVFYHKACFTPIIRLKVIVPQNETLLPKFLYYFLSNFKISSNKKVGGIPNLNANDIKRIKLFVPSLESQMKIIEFLDVFQTLVNDQEKGIPAEIAAVKKQYEYYRNKLLTFSTQNYKE